MRAFVVLSWVLAGLVLTRLGGVDATTRPSSVRLANNSYTGVVVAIHNKVEESQELIDQIQAMFTEASAYLYEATRKRAYFKEVTILVPRSWTPRPHYQLPGNLTFDFADVIVAPPNPRWAPLQYTKQYQGCGERGVHIHFMDEFLTDPNTTVYYGPHGRTLVHEWGHFRWGLFDEYPDPVGDPDNYQEFYFSPNTQKFEGVRCSYSHDGDPLVFFPNQSSFRPCAGDPDVGYEEGCVFYLHTKQTDVSASIMYSSYPLSEINYFCDDDKSNFTSVHNREAPNKHNRLCKRKSAWEVLQEHVDFKDGQNAPRELSPDELIPEFHFVQHRDISVVVLMDTSGSMNIDNRFEKMISSSANYISSIVTDGSYIGIVEFNSVATKLRGLTLVTSDADRQDLLDALPPSPGGSTGIGNGLLASVEVLSEGGRDPAGGIILLITDGQEDQQAPRMADVIEDLVAARVIVDTLAFTQAADSALTDLSLATGGKPYYYSNEQGSSTLYEAFAATMERGDVLDSEKRVQLMGTSWLLAGYEERSTGVFMDSTLGNNTKFVFAWTTQNSVAIDVNITAPDGTSFDSAHAGYGLDVSFRILTVSIPGKAEVGSWEISVTNKMSSYEDVTVTISSYPASDDVEPIVVTSELCDATTAFGNSKLLMAYAEVRQGFSPMIYANVYATIERPGAFDPVTLQLLDNGAGADVTKNDGVYSRTFTAITGIGYYGVKIDVDNNGGNAIIIDSVPFSKARPIIDPEEVFNLPDIGGVKLPVPGTPPTEPTGQPAPDFSRGISGGSSRVDTLPPGFVPGADIFPPGDIVDLRVNETDFANGTVTLLWTAPGDDLDNGAASLYIIVRAESVEAWQADQNPDNHTVVDAESILVGDPDSPQPFGAREVFVVRVPVPADAAVVSYVFAVRAADEVSQTSAWSNAAQALLRASVPTALPPPVHTTLPPPTSTAPPPPNSTAQPPPKRTALPPVAPLESWQIALIAVGGVLALAALVLVGTAVFLVVIRKRRSSPKDPSTPLELVKEDESPKQSQGRYINEGATNQAFV